MRLRIATMAGAILLAPIRPAAALDSNTGLFVAGMTLIYVTAAYCDDNQEQISTFKEYIERQVAANRDFGEELLRAKDFQEAFRIQVEYFQSQLKGAASDAAQIGAKMAGSSKTFIPPEPNIA